VTIPAENSPDLWRDIFPFPQVDSHKYSRGTALIRGGASMTGATRLAARAAQRIGAGLVTLAAPASAAHIYAESLESVIVRPCDDVQSWAALANDAHRPALLIGPGLGVGPTQAQEVLAALATQQACIVDADGLTVFADRPETLFQSLHANCVITPHEGEFARLFGSIAGDRLTAALDAARRAGCVLVLKGAETIIAAPDGSAVVNRNAPPWLATAGSGDVLAGMILGLAAQKMPLFHAACAAVWAHGLIATIHGPGLIAEDIVGGIPGFLREMIKSPVD
jgi:NAD(P)H-hydrate epimerase